MIILTGSKIETVILCASCEESLEGDTVLRVKTLPRNPDAISIIPLVGDLQDELPLEAGVGYVHPGCIGTYMENIFA